MKKQAVLFVDSSNFYHSLKEQKDLPFGARQYKSLVEKLNFYFDITRVIFYDAIKDRTKDPTGYAKQQRFHSHLQKEITLLEVRQRKLKYVVSINKDRVKKESRILGIPSEFDDKLYLLFKKLGLVRLTREKGLDVLLVVDALNVHKQNGDVAILILSGDSDYAPVVEFMKKNGAQVVNVHPYSGSSKELRDVCSEHILINIDTSGEVELKRIKKDDQNTP